jgi:PAS domain S-box-containing protein
MALNEEGDDEPRASAEQRDEHLLVPLQSWTELTWATDAEGVIDWVDRRGFESMVEPLVGQTWESAVHPDDRTFVHELWEKAKRSGGVFESEHRLRVPEGEYRWFLARAWPLRDQSGRIDRWFGSSSDIEEIKQAEQAYVEAEPQVDHGLMAEASGSDQDNELELAHLLDLRFIQPLMDTWYSQTQMGASIQDTHGARHYAACRWQRICSDFHKVNGVTRQRCLDSDTKLAEGIRPGQWRIRECKNHLWDIATPIVINGKQIGTIFTGQFFLDGSEPSRELFRAQAKRYGFVEDDYLAAFDEVPRLSAEHVEKGISLLVALSNIIAGLCYARMKLDRATAENDVLSELLAKQRDITGYVEATTNTGSWQLKVASGTVHLSDQARRILGLPSKSSFTVEEIVRMIHPDDRHSVDGTLSLVRDPLNIECRILAPEQIVVQVLAWRSYDGEGKLTEVTGIVKGSLSGPTEDTKR